MTDRELIIACAEKVIGLRPIEQIAYSGERIGVMYDVSRTSPLFVWDEDSPYARKIEGWNPLESDSDAFTLVDAMRAEGWMFSLQQYPIGMTRAVFTRSLPADDDEPNEEAAESRRRAIVLAALRAKGITHA